MIAFYSHHERHPADTTNLPQKGLATGFPQKQLAFDAAVTHARHLGAASPTMTRGQRTGEQVFWLRVESVPAVRKGVCVARCHEFRGPGTARVIPPTKTQVAVRDETLAHVNLRMA
jgi:hypothetical protein